KRPTGIALRAAVFFAGRRLHTMLKCDWSADVCTADLKPAAGITSTSAILEGTINANDKEATWHFDYATDADFQASGTYTSSTPRSEERRVGNEWEPRWEQAKGV